MAKREIDPRIEKRFWWIAIVLTFLASAVHYYLADKFYGMVMGTAGGPSLCNINSYLNCDAVSMSKYAVFFGKPLALWGVLGNLLLATLMIIGFTGFAADPARVRRFAFYFAGVVALTSVILILISFTQMSVLCIFCMLNHFFAFSVFALLYFVRDFDPIKMIGDDLKSLVTTHKWVTGLVISVPMLVWLIDGEIRSSGRNGGPAISKVFIQEKINHWKVSPQYTFSDELGIVTGASPDQAKMTIVEFADALCPHCKMAFPIIHNFAKLRPDVRLVYKFYPLDGGCNSRPEMHAGDGMRCLLPYLVYCSEKIGKVGMDAQEFVFKQQEKWPVLGPEQSRVEVAKAVKIDLAEMNKCVDDEATRKNVMEMAAEGNRAQVAGTPAFYINGRMLGSAQILSILEAAYKEIVESK